MVDEMLLEALLDEKFENESQSKGEPFNEALTNVEEARKKVDN